MGVFGGFGIFRVEGLKDLGILDVGVYRDVRFQAVPALWGGGARQHVESLEGRKGPQLKAV